jgi:thiol-disulfide isomerase/thioredoxin
MHYLQLLPDTITQMVRTLGQKFPNHPMIMEIEGMVASQQAATFPDLTAVRLPDVQGASNEITMESAALTILDFWASWCGPCKVEAKSSLLPLHKQYNDKGLKIIGISTDTDSTKWKNALEKEHYPWINVWDHENTYANLFSVKSLPTIVVLDKKGNVIAYDLRGESLNQFVRDHFAMMGNK